MPTQQDLARQMIQQLRVLDPSISGEVGTPERKIIDTVAQAISENSIDLESLGSGLDINTKIGSDLDNFVALFGFGRQLGVSATGFVTFSRSVASNYDIPIPRDTVVKAGNVVINGSENVTNDIRFYVTEPVTLKAGELSVIAPVRAVLVGTAGNLAAGKITQFGNTPILGITDITNEIPTLNGLDAETDDELKIRFRNTLFRNVSGTTDQYLALAISTASTTKANVIGSVSRYREYIQVPDVDDSSADPDSGITGNGSPTEYTTALSTIPYSKYTYTAMPTFLSNGSNGLDARFFIETIDYRVNTSNADRDRGDAYRGRVSSTGDSALVTNYKPNVTLINVYTGSDSTVEAIRPRDILLLEHSYISTASRNDYGRQLLNCVDVFINGSNPVLADCTIPPISTVAQFTALTSSRFYVNNFRRVGEKNRTPVLGNVFTPLYNQPVVDLPDSIETLEATYIKGVHYWAVEDVTELGGTVRARNGIEWAVGVAGYDGGTAFNAPNIVANTATSLDIFNYQYDRNIPDLQVACEGAKQVTTDVLVHQATKRYFKLDITVMYAAGVSISDVNQSVHDAVELFYKEQYFGTALQLSDLLQTIHNVAGVDNVRWSKELLTGNTDISGNPRHRVVEVNANGRPLTDVCVDFRTCSTAAACVQTIVLTGAPTGGTYTLSYNGNSSTFNYNDNAATLQTGLRTITGDASLTVSGSGLAEDPFIVTFSTVGVKELIEGTPNFTSASSYYNADFFLSDDELPAIPTDVYDADSVPGLVVRTRAQNTWNQL